MWGDKGKPRVNGELLSNFIDRDVCLLGLVTEVANDRMSLKLKSSDDQIIHVQRRQPNNDYLEGYVEVHGKVTSNSSVISSFMITFPTDYTKDFDFADYNEAVITTQKCRQQKLP